MQNPASRIQVRHASKSFMVGRSETSRLKVLDDISFDVEAGEFFCILGPSGCGKTTLLKMIGGVTDLDGGEILIDDVQVKGPGSSSAMVFQNFRLLPWRNVATNVEFGLKARGVGREERRAAASKYVELVGLKGFESYYPHQVSGGMQQRVALARALATNAGVLLMDEPLSALDAQTRETLQIEVLKVWERTQRTIVFVTHDPDEAIFLGQRILLLSTRPSRIKDIITVDLQQPRWKFEIWKEPRFIEIKSKVVSNLKS